LRKVSRADSALREGHDCFSPNIAFRMSPFGAWILYLFLATGKACLDAIIPADHCAVENQDGRDAHDREIHGISYSEFVENERGSRTYAYYFFLPFLSPRGLWPIARCEQIFLLYPQCMVTRKLTIQYKRSKKYFIV
jgi:hypothetical protein